MINNNNNNNNNNSNNNNNNNNNKIIKMCIPSPTSYHLPLHHLN